MSRRLRITTAAGLILSLAALDLPSLKIIADASAAELLPSSRYAGRVQGRMPTSARPQLAGAPASSVLRPALVQSASSVPAPAPAAPIQLASAQWMAPSSPGGEGSLMPQSLIPVLPKASIGPRPMLYPSKIGSPRAPEVLPVPGDVAVPASVPSAPSAAAMPMPGVAGESAAPAVLPLPEAMSSGGAAPQFKPYATIETQTGSVPREVVRTQALDELNKMEQMMDGKPQAVPALPPVAEHPQPQPQPQQQMAYPQSQMQAQPQPAAMEAAPAAPAVLPLPDEMQRQVQPQSNAAGKQFLREGQSSHKGLSDDTKRVLGMMPGGVDAPKDGASSRLAVKRYNPEVEGVLNKEEEGEVASSESTGAKIAVRRPVLDADYELQQAYDALSRGQLGEAAEGYQRVVANYPRNDQALFGLAATYHQMGEVGQAREYYKRLLAIDPDHRDGLNNFLVLVADESPEDALHQLQQLERRNPNFSPIPAQMAIIYSKMGNFDAAQRKMAQAVQLSPSNLAYQYNLAIIMDRLGNYDQAATLYRGLIKADQRGEEVPAEMDEIQQRLVYIDRVRTN